MLARPGDAPRSVYVRGVRVAEDDGLLFSYNVTKVDAKLRRALNRERSNVGRSAYTDRIKAILLAVEAPVVLTRLVDDMAGFAKGATRDEVKWNDVAERVVRQLAVSDPDTVFVTAAQRWSHPELIRRAEIDGKHVFVIPDALAARLRAANDGTVTTLERFAAEWNDRVVIEPIDPSHLDADERTVLDLAGEVLALVGRRRDEWDVVVSATLHLTPDGTETAHGLWEPAQRRIVIHRSCLADAQLFVGTLLHEIGHAVTGATDLTARFEDGLTDLLGTVGTHAVTPADGSRRWRSTSARRDGIPSPLHVAADHARISQPPNRRSRMWRGCGGCRRSRGSQQRSCAHRTPAAGRRPPRRGVRAMAGDQQCSRMRKWMTIDQPLPFTSTIVISYV